MTDDKQHLDIDLEFLDKNSSKKEEPAHYEARKNDHTSRLKLSRPLIKKILIIGGIVIFFGWAIFSDNNSSTSSNNSGSYAPPRANQTSFDNDTIVIGEYRCSRYNYDKAVALAPSESEQQIDTARNALEYRSNELDRLQNEIESSYVNEYSSQWEIDQYNESVDEYNSKLPAYKRDAASFESRVDRYNVQVEKHNNYLMTNCTKRY